MKDGNFIQRELIKKILNDASDSVGIRLCAIGVDLGLFEDLSKLGPSTSQEIAGRMLLNERHIRE